MLTFVVCDDNPTILDRLCRSLESIFIKHDIDAIVGLQSTIPEEIIEYVDKNKVDVMILDINLKSKINGCDIADIVRKKNKYIYIIFSTAHLEYALIAYKYKTFDYLPKPIAYEKLEETILRLVDDMFKAPSKFIRLDNNKTIIKQSEVNYIKKDGMKLVFCTNNRDYEVYSSFNKIQSCLPENFIRCHKSYIVNIDNVIDISTSKNSILFSKNDQCSIGSKYKNDFMEVFKYGNNSKYMGGFDDRESYSD